MTSPATSTSSYKTIRDRTSARYLIGTVRRAQVERRITPAAVEAYARLMLQTDEGEPMVPAPHHRLWLELMCDWTHIPNLLILAPPEAAKTSWVVSAFTGLYVAVYPESSVILVSSSGDTARKRSDSLRAMIKTWRYRYVFPTIRPVDREGLRWTMNEWSVAPNGEPYPGRLHPTVSAFGTGGSIIGSRADLLVSDDLLDMGNTRTDTGRRETRDWVHSSFLSRRKARVSRTIVIGTPWNPDDAYAEFERSGVFVVCRTPLLSEAGSSVYAEITYPDSFRGRKLGVPTGEPGEDKVPMLEGAA